MKEKCYSARCIEALRIIESLRSVRAKQFGLFFWPGSSLHTHLVSGRKSVVAGKAGWLCAGSYLGRLKKMGLAECVPADVWKTRLTEEGREVLAAAEKGETT